MAPGENPVPGTAATAEEPTESAPTLTADANCRPPVALSIAGTDPSGGAGIHADLKTFTAHSVYGTTVITALVAQNTHGVSRVCGIDDDFVTDQFDSVLTDVPVDASKTGMLGTAALVELVAARAGQGQLGFLVVDPVMVATSGHRLLDADAVDSVRRLIVPAADLLTPNLPEAALLLGDDVAAAQTPDEMEAQARELLARGARGVLLKGGHAAAGLVTDVLALSDGSGGAWVSVFHHDRVDTPNTHGTGCTLSAALTAQMARTVWQHRGAGQDRGRSTDCSGGQTDAHGVAPEQIESAVSASLDYLARALRSASRWQLSYDSTGAHGPVDHTVDIPEPKS